jgi:amidohydrolase
MHVRVRMGLLAVAAISVFAFGFCSELDSPAAAAEPSDIDARVAALESQIIAWRRDFHANPELSNREVRTAGIVAAHLDALGLEVRTGIAHTGVVGVLRGALPGPVVALRADMDALPVTEELDLPFASKVRTTYEGREVGVMHACGHDAHVAILMGAAQVLSEMRDRIRGTVLFVFQPAEEGAPAGEKGGASLMLAEGVFADPNPDVVFGLHVVPQHPVGTIGYRARGAMASSDRLHISVKGSQTHAAYPWLGVDPIAVGSRIVLALESIPARRVDTRIPSVVTIAMFHGGVRGNIIPAEAELTGTIRSLDPVMRFELHEAVKSTATKVAEAAGAVADVEIRLGYPITYNDPQLVTRMRPTLERVAGRERALEVLPRTGAEDFSFFQEGRPGLYFWLGVRPTDAPDSGYAPNHSPYFFVDEGALALGVRAMVNLTLDYPAE